MDSKYEIVRYCDEFAERWDTFLETIVNGTFLQSRRFLSYHPVGRFKDCSLIIYDQKKNLVGLCPAVVQMESGRRHFVSHPGSTFGGLIVSSKNYRATKLIEMLKSMECFLRENDFHDVDLHITPTIFSQESDALMEYVLNYLGYQESVELNTYIDYDDYMIPVEKNFTQGKRSEVHKSQRQHLYGRRIQNLDELTTQTSQVKIPCTP